MKIFVSVTSFCDPHLRFTLTGLFQKAVEPENLRVALIDQSNDENRSWISAMPWAENIRYLQMSPIDSCGCSWARALAFSFFRGEEYLLQVDSHTHFEQGWDAKLLAHMQFLQTQSPRSILSTYPPGFHFDESGQPVLVHAIASTVYRLRPIPEQNLSANKVTLRFEVRHVAHADYVIGHHLAGGFLMAPGSFVEDVPYDPYLYFHGDEQSMALRAFTRGWTIYHPRHDEVPLFHLYQEPGTIYATQHWRQDLEEQRAVRFSELTLRAQARLCNLVNDRVSSQSYGLGKARNLDAYASESGINYAALSIREAQPIRLLRGHKLMSA